MRFQLDEIWSEHEDLVHETGSENVVKGPTYKLAMYIQIFTK